MIAPSVPDLNDSRSPSANASGRELGRFSALAGGAVFGLAVLLTGLPLAGGLVGLAAFFAVVRYAARESPPSPLGPANRLTLLRLAVLAVLAGTGFAATNSLEARLLLAGWLPCLLYAVAALCDYADGAVARRTGSESAFGARLDAEADALGLAAASGIAVFATGTLPAWYLLAGFGRYLFGAALFVEERFGRRMGKLPPSPFRRRLAGFQMGLVAVCLAPFIEPEWAPPATAALGIPFLIGFGRDYLIASRRLDPERPKSQQFVSALQRLRAPASAVAAVLTAALVAAKLAGLATGSEALAAVFFAWLMFPGRRVPAGARA